MSQDLQPPVTDSVASPPGAARVGEEHRLRGNMGVAQLVFLVLAFNAPIGIVAGLLPLVIGYGGGIGAPLLLLFVAGVLAIFSVGYTVAARKLPRAGAFYAFVTAGLGRPMGLATGFVAVATYALGYLGTVPFVGISAEQLLSGFGIAGTPWWVWALILALIIGVLGYLRIDFSAKVLGVVVVLEVAAVLIYSAVVLASGGSTGQLTFGSFNPATIANGGAIVALVFVVTAFGGFESTAIFRDEVRDPQRTVPRATYIAVGTIGVLYALSAWVLVQATGEDAVVGQFAADPGTAFLASVQQYLGLVAFNLIGALLLTSTLASLTGLHNVLARYLFNLGVDGILPRALGRPHHKFGSPHRASLSLSVLVVGFIIIAAVTAIPATTVYSTLIGIAGYALVVLYLLAAIGLAAYLFKTRPADASVWHWAIAPIISVVTMLALTILVTLNLDLLTGSPVLSAISLLVPVVAIVAGVLVALVVRSKNPAQYQQIGTRE